MTIHHLSHTDLDGYGAQVITNHYFKNVKFYNSNYGKEIDEKFDQILAQISDKNSASAESNLSGEILEAQIAQAKEQNLENRSQIAQNLESEKPQPSDSENDVAANEERNLQEAKDVESNLDENLDPIEQPKTRSKI